METAHFIRMPMGPASKTIGIGYRLQAKVLRAERHQTAIQLLPFCFQKFLGLKIRTTKNPLSH